MSSFGAQKQQLLGQQPALSLKGDADTLSYNSVLIVTVSC